VRQDEAGLRQADGPYHDCIFHPHQPI